MNQDHKIWIDKASYIELLTRWRFAKSGDPILQGESGEYFQKIMNEKRQLTDHVRASKIVGWDDKYAKKKFSNSSNP